MLTPRKSWLRSISLIAVVTVAANSLQAHAVTDVYAAVKESGSINPDAPIAELWVRSGKYAIFGKINIDQDDTKKWGYIICHLRAHTFISASSSLSDFDRVEVRLYPSSVKYIDNVTVPFQVVHEFPVASINKIELSCTFNPNDSEKLSFRFAKIMAVRLDTLLCEKPTEAVCP